MRGNREIHRKPMDMGFVRKADGRLRPATEDRDIKDVWADLERARLRDAIERDQKKRFRKERRRRLFSASKKPSQAHTPAEETGKTVEIKINLAGFSLDWLRSGSKRAWRFLKSTTKKQRKVAVGMVAFLVLFAASFSLYGNNTSKKNEDKEKRKQEVASVQTDDGLELPKGVPDYQTLLPFGKTIEQLGGWRRVSPEGSDPVYAFADRVDGVAITVSQQPLPEGLKEDPAGVSKLAEQFAATQKIPAGAGEAYVGTSTKGPQSVIMVKNNLLLLIKSNAALSNSAWGGYLATLQ